MPAAVDYFIEFSRSFGQLVSPYTEVLERQFTTHVWDAIVPKSLSNHLYNYLDEHMTPHARNLPMMNPFDAVLITLAYVAVVLIGKSVMSHYERWSLKRFTMFHNLCMVTLSTYMLVGIIQQAIVCNYNVWQTPIDNTENGWDMAKILWLFYFSKIPEFMDTFIMVMKKNNRQISFLHVYHHVSVFLFQWLTVRIATTGDGYLTAALNSGIHVIMYGYYFLSAAGYNKQLSFIKHKITSMQMAQFVLNLYQSGSNMYLGFNGYPMILSQILFVYMITLLVLFGNFLIRDKRRLATAKAKAALEKSKKAE